MVHTKKRLPEARIDRLEAMLTRLQLSIGPTTYSMTRRANLPARETLLLVHEREIASNDHRRIEMALKLAHSPTVKELAASRSRRSRQLIRSRSASGLRHVGSPTARMCCCSIRRASVDGTRLRGDPGRLRCAVHHGVAADAAHLFFQLISCR